jgi:hypothetical protein
LGIPLGFDPTKNDLGHIDLEGLDSGTKDIDDVLDTTYRFGGTLRIRPQHGVPFAWAWNNTDYNVGASPYTHCLANLTDEDYDLNSMSLEVTNVHSTPASSFKEWYDGVKFNTLELRFDKGTPLCELTIDFDAQDSDNINEAPESYETTLSNLKKYNARVIDPVKRPFMFHDVYVEILGTELQEVINGRVKIDNQLLADFVCNATVGRRIAEPTPQRRKYEIEITARMKDSTYYDHWRDVSNIGEVTGNIDNAVGYSDTATSIVVDDGAGAEISNLPSIGILKVTTDASTVEYMHYYDVTDNGTDHTLKVVRGCYGSTATNLEDNNAMEFYGAVTVLLNKGTDALGSIDLDGDEDYLLFTAWGGAVRTFGAPRDITGGIIEQTFLITPKKCVVTAVDDIDKGYFDTS